ncbi:hypothetical protein PoB_005460300 [Plakobranchus ocellatus]|uniref:Uncharacterized protein n=1 Tax=Plakobranchus ocellatus TaxID=259542 RepID=A0AAV4C9A8_9GAST|nr:hypothetical protein PoB_005460300 [Plakobranchus ocellatus]
MESTQPLPSLIIVFAYRKSSNIDNAASTKAESKSTRSGFEDDAVSRLTSRSSSDSGELGFEDFEEEDFSDDFDEDNAFGHQYRSYLSGSPLINNVLILWHIIILVSSQRNE